MSEVTYKMLIDNGWTDELIVTDGRFIHLLPQQIIPLPPQQIIPLPPQPEILQSPEIVITQQSTDETNITNTTKFVPNDQNNIITELTPAKFDNFVKILGVLTKGKNVDAILIRDSKVLQIVNECIIEADMLKLINYNDTPVSIDILNPKKYISMLEQFSGNSNIFILDDDINKRFIVTNGRIRLFMPKQQQLQHLQITPFDYTESTQIAQMNLNKITRKNILSLAKDKNTIDYLIKNSCIKGVHIADTAIFVFEEYLNDPEINELDETNADIVLRSIGFLPFETEMYDISLYKMSDNTHSCKVTCQIGGLIDITIMESLSDVTGGNINIFSTL